MKSVYSAVRTGASNKADYVWSLERLNGTWRLFISIRCTVHLLLFCTMANKSKIKNNNNNNNKIINNIINCAIFGYIKIWKVLVMTVLTQPLDWRNSKISHPGLFNFEVIADRTYCVCILVAPNSVFIFRGKEMYFSFAGKQTRMVLPTIQSQHDTLSGFEFLLRAKLTFTGSKLHLL
jgi:hypothetical protein